MRDLRRLRHTQPPSPKHIGRIQRREDLTLRRRRVSIWRQRAQRLLILAIVGLVVVGAGVVLTRDIVIDGLVLHPNMISPTAPAEVRVTEVLVEPGDTCERGEVLARLEAVNQTPRRTLEAEVEERRTRLALVRAGGGVDGADIGRRFDLVEQAELEAEIARGEHGVALARLEALREENDVLVATLAQTQVELSSKTVSLREGIRRAVAGEERAVAEYRRAAFDATQRSELEKAGIGSRRDSLAAEVDRSTARSRTTEAAALVESFERALRVADELIELEIDRGKKALDAMLARIEVAVREVESSRVRTTRWTELAEERRTLLPDEYVDGAQLRELELRVLEAQVRRSEAQLARLDQELGNLTLRAETSGLVDQVFVSEGSIVEAGAPLVRYYDPSEMRIVVYAEPGVAQELQPNSPCRVHVPHRPEAIDARVHSVGLSWTMLPNTLQATPEKPSAAPYLPIRVQCIEHEDLSTLRPNSRLRIVARGRSWPWE